MWIPLWTLSKSPRPADVPAWAGMSIPRLDLATNRQILPMARKNLGWISRVSSETLTLPAWAIALVATGISPPPAHARRRIGTWDVAPRRLVPARFARATPPEWSLDCSGGAVAGIACYLCLVHWFVRWIRQVACRSTLGIRLEYPDLFDRANGPTRTSPICCEGGGSSDSSSCHQWIHRGTHPVRWWYYPCYGTWWLPPESRWVHRLGSWRGSPGAYGSRIRPCTDIVPRGYPGVQRWAMVSPPLEKINRWRHATNTSRDLYDYSSWLPQGELRT